FDGEAVRYCADTSLKELGLTAQGDRLALKAFCDEKPADERKLTLLKQLKQRWNSTKKVDGSNPKPKNKEVKTRRVMLGWMRYDKKPGRYVRVSLTKGGGTRKMDLPINFSKNDVIEYAKKVFFPSNEDLQGNFSFDLANFKQSKVDTLTDTDGEVHEFSVGKYFEVSKTHQINLYLMTRELHVCDTDDEDDFEQSVFDTNTSTEKSPVHTTRLSKNSCTAVTVDTLPSSGGHQHNLSLIGDTDDEDDFHMLKSVSDTNTSTGTPPVHTTYLSNNTSARVTVNTPPSSGRHQKKSSPIGSSYEREMIKHEQDAEYQASLKIDQENQQKKLTSEVSSANQKALQAARLQRVPPEPALAYIKQLKVYIRHPSRGLVSRAFREDEKMMSVYDWCGSLEPVPEHFSLCTSHQKIVLPQEPIISVKGIMLYVHVQEEPQELVGKDTEVTFKGFGWSDEHGIEDDTLPLADKEMLTHTFTCTSSDYSIEKVQETLPKNIMEVDHTSTISDDDGEGSSSYQHYLQRESSLSASPGMRFRQWVNEVFEARCESEGENNDDPEDSDEITEVKQVTVKRSTILHDALELYCDPHIVECKLNVTFKGEQGIDFGGVTEDFFCSFWEAAFAEYFEGDVVKIPLATPIKMSAISNSILPALGRILEHGWRLTRKIPVRFCEASFIALVYGEEAVPNQVLKRSFLWYINQFERDILCSLLEGEKVADYKKDAIFGLYQRFSMQCLPAKTEEALKEHIITMARAEFVFKPMFFLSAMRRGIGEDNLKALQKELPIDKISELYDELSPTCETGLAEIKERI
ncbi:hypothetical protein QZH41_019695, partial [Actinostola sp. cb2023]